MALKKTSGKIKKTAPKKKTGLKKKGIKKGSKFVCAVCGLVVSVDEACGCIEMCDIICCGKQMRAKK
jgi:hypothetical protein